MTESAVSVVIVTYNSERDIEACLDSVLAHEEVGGSPLDVVVVDNASSDATVALVRARGDALTVVESRENRGFAAGVNVGIANARGAEILLLNPDCVVSPGCVSVLHDVLSSDGRAGAVGALLANPDGTPQLFARRDITPRIAFWCLTELGRHLDGRWRGNRWRAHRRYEQAWPPVQRAEFDAIAAACVLVRRPLDGVLLDEDFPLMFNDTDLYARLREGGWSVTIEPRAHGVHGYGTTLLEIPRPRYNAEMLASLTVYARKHWPVRWRLGWLALQVVDVLGAIALLTRPNAKVIGRADLAALAGAWGLPGGAPPWLIGPRGRRPGPTRG